MTIFLLALTIWQVKLYEHIFSAIQKALDLKNFLILFENLFPHSHFIIAGVTKNNNKIQTEDDPYTKDTLLQELQEMAEEKSKLALQLGEKNGQLNLLRNEISKLKVYHNNKQSC